MEFKNDFERACFDAVKSAIGGDGVELHHNRVLVADFVPGKGVISFTGPPRKEIDVLVARVSDAFSLLISAKDFEKRAPPATIQEWASVVQTMNAHAVRGAHLGLVVCSSGFTSGCVAWAIDSNLAMVPPYKGKPANYPREMVPQMLERAVRVSHRLVSSGAHDVSGNSNYYWSVYKCLADFPEPAD